MIRDEPERVAKQTRDDSAAPAAAEGVKRRPALRPAAADRAAGDGGGGWDSTLAGLRAARPSSCKPLISEMRKLQPRETP